MKNKIIHRLSFWLTLGVILDFFLINIHLNDSSSWVSTVAPSLRGQVYPHIATALLMYGFSFTFIVLAFGFFTYFVLRIATSGVEKVPFFLKGYWVLSLLAFISVVIPIVSLRYPQWHLTDLRIGAALNVLFTSTFLVTGVIANLNSKED